MRVKFLALASSLLTLILLSGCSTGGISKNNENAFVSGNGVVTYVNPENRKKAPELSGKTLDGNTLQTSAGKITIVNVWASWCSPCRAEAPLLEDFAQKRSDIQIVGILTRDNLSSAQSFVKRFHITYPSLVDDSILTHFRESLVPNAIPTTLIIDRKWRVAARVSGSVTVAGLEEIVSKVASHE